MFISLLDKLHRPIFRIFAISFNAVAARSPKFFYFTVGLRTRARPAWSCWRQVFSHVGIGHVLTVGRSGQTYRSTITPFPLGSILCLGCFRTTKTMHQTRHSSNDDNNLAPHNYTFNIKLTKQPAFLNPNKPQHSFGSPTFPFELLKKRLKKTEDNKSIKASLQQNKQNKIDYHEILWKEE